MIQPNPDPGGNGNLAPADQTVEESLHADCEPLEFLKELVADGLQKNETLFRAASAGVVDLLENSIRVGFYLSDARAYLVGEGKFIRWVEANFKISYPSANRLRRLSTHFSRDLVDSQQRERLGISPKGLDVAIGPHVRNQITATGARSLSDLFRVTGILPPLSLPGRRASADAHHGRRNGSAPTPEPAPAPSNFRIADLFERMQELAENTDPARLSSYERKALRDRLLPIVKLYSALKTFD
jgi:hypothetical protein